MRSIDIDLAVHKAIEDGRQSFEESENSILRRLLKIDRAGTLADSPSVHKTPPRGTRSSGAYSVVIDGKPLEGNTLKDLLHRCLLALEKRQPGFLKHVAATDTRRGRKIIARSPEGVYPHAPHLRELAARLNEHWWFDGNVSREQVSSYLRKFTELAALPTVPTITKRAEKTMLTLKDLDL